MPVSIAVAPDFAPTISARGAATINNLNGQNAPDNSARLALDVSADRGFSEGRPSSDAPIDTDEGPGETGDRPGPGPVARIRIGEELGVPEPQIAGMITSLLPFDRAALVDAVDQILGPIDGLVSSMPELRGPIRMVTASLAVAVTVLAVDVAIRLRRLKDEEVEAGGVEGLVEFPGLPGFRRWSRS